MANIKIRKSRVVPYPARLAATVLLVLVYAWLLQSLTETWFMIVGIIIAPALPVIWMSVNILEVNDDQKYWWRYQWLLGLKRGKKQPYGEIQHIGLRRIEISNKKNKIQVRYEGFIRFDTSEEMILTTRKSMEFMQENMRKLADKTDVGFIDHTNQ